MMKSKTEFLCSVSNWKERNKIEFVIGLIAGGFIGFTVAAVIAVSSDKHNPPTIAEQDPKKET